MAKLVKFWTALHTSYWFVPSLMSVVAGVLSFVLVMVDHWLGDGWIGAVPWLYRVQASGARDILTTIAGSMIGVAGVTFSITIAALSYTTTTLGPRLLTNFMSDKGNQITLGTFVSAFVYCVLLLRTIQANNDVGGHFVPHVAIAFAILLAMAGLAVLIYFIHHITESLHVSNVIADIAADLNEAIEAHHKRACDTEDNHPPAALPADFSDNFTTVRALESGYIQNLVYSSLLAAATRHDLVIRLVRVPGDFAGRAQTLAEVWPASRVDEQATKAIRETFAIGPQRTQSQDVLFLVNELVEIAARALSPGTNDPYTAMSCLDWLSSALNRMARRRMPSLIYFDDRQTLRIWAPVFDFEVLADAIFDQLRHYFCRDVNAAEYMLDCMGETGEFIQRNNERRCLRRHAESLYEAAGDRMSNTRDRERVDIAARRALRRLTHPSERTDALLA